MKKIVVSAVNLNKGGTLAILRDCLAHLSELAKSIELEVVAIVYDKSLAYYPNITYIETQWPKKRWINRLWFEYVSMKRISKEIGPIYLWFSLHDTTPNVIADKRAVYCHNSFPFYQWKFRELLFAPKIVMFALFTKYIYKVNIHKNDFVVVQQEWFRREFIRMFGLSKEKIIVSPPERKPIDVMPSKKTDFNLAITSFLFPASADSHKNFEVICEAAAILEQNQEPDFQVLLTIRGDENKYTKWLYEKYSHLKSIKWLGFLTKEDLLFYYENVSCLIFSSKVESWGLPISEFKTYNKPMLLADLPYAHEAAGGATKVAFYNPNKESELSILMEGVIKGKDKVFSPISNIDLKEPIANNWSQLFDVLLTEKR